MTDQPQEPAPGGGPGDETAPPRWATPQPQWPSPPPGWQPYGQVPPQRTGTNGFAIASLVLGIGSLVLGIASLVLGIGSIVLGISSQVLGLPAVVLGLVGVYWIGSILALVFGYIAKRQIRETGESGSGLATAGIVLGWVGVGWLLVFIIVAAIVGSNEPSPLRW
ncbi:MAG: hypothetical protein C4321_04980 [Chloroflexota bacterium]